MNLSHSLNAVADVLAAQRENLNRADAVNSNHGDHMVEAFQVAAQAARENAPRGLTDALDAVSQRLAGLENNGSAQVYSRGLASFVEQFRKHEIAESDLARAVQPVIENRDLSAISNSGNVFQALVGAMASWQRAENGEPPDDREAGMGYWMEIGMAYMQAQRRGSSPAQVLADAAVTASPLSRVPHREMSGKLALQTFLEAVLD